MLLPNGTRSAAKEMTFGQVMAIANPDVSVPGSSESLTDRVWVVALSVGLRPIGITVHGADTWTVDVIDQKTGEAWRSMGGSDAAHWPPYFDRLPDIAHAVMSGPRIWTPRVALLVVTVVVGSMVVVTSGGAASAAGTNPVWSIEASPDTSSSQINILNAVSCTGSSSCMAVGSSDTGMIDQTLIESWNGGVWSIVPSPDTSSTASNELWGVSCTSATACTAVGDVDNDSVVQTLVESWNGVAWSIVPSPDTSPSTYNSLHAVSCTGPTSCMAVGVQNVAGANQTLVEAWNGVAWSIVVESRHLAIAVPVPERGVVHRAVVVHGGRRLRQSRRPDTGGELERFDVVHRLEPQCPRYGR